MADDKNLKDDHGKMSDDDLYLKMVMLYQVEDPEAWEVAKHLQQRGTLDKPRMTDVEHIINSPAPQKPTKAEALLARIYDEAVGYAAAEIDQKKMTDRQALDAKANMDKARAVLDTTTDPAAKAKAQSDFDQFSRSYTRLAQQSQEQQKKVLIKLASAGKGPAKVSGKGRYV